MTYTKPQSPTQATPKASTAAHNPTRPPAITPRPILVALFALILAAAFTLTTTQTANAATSTNTTTTKSTTQPTPLADEPSDIAFVDVTLVPMDSMRVIPGQTLVVRDGLIALIGPTDLVNIPENARIIQGNGRYLMPGLADMHLYFASVPRGAAERNERMLILLLAHGITMTREMSGGQSLLELRDQISTGRVAGPRIIVGAPVLQGPPPNDDGSPGPVRTRHDGINAVIAQHGAGYQFVGVSNNVSEETYLGVLEAAEDVGLKVAGRVPSAIGVLGALRYGQSTIDFFDNVAETIESEDSPVRGSTLALQRQRAIEHVDQRKLNELLDLAAKSKTVWVPTFALNTYRWNVADPETERALLNRPAVRSMDPVIPPSWSQWSNALRDAIVNQNASPKDAKDFVARLIRLMHARGITLMLGTGSPHMFCVPGATLHEEMQLIADHADLNPYEVLRLATVNPARWIGDDRWNGTIDIGRRADLVLVEENPLVNIRNASKIAGVLVGGLWAAPGVERARWYDAQELQEKLQAFANEPTPTPPGLLP